MGLAPACALLPRGGSRRGQGSRFGVTSSRLAACSSGTRRTRALLYIDQPAPPPPDAGEPRARPCNRRRIDHARRTAAPAVEPSRRRAWIEAASCTNVFPEIVQHVDERIPYLTWRPQQAGVIPVAPDAAMAPERAVDGLRHADREPSHAAFEARRLIRLHQQVQMVGLNTEVQHAKSLGAGGGQRDPRGNEDASVSEGGNAGSRPQCDMDGTVAVVRNASSVRDGATTRRGLTAGAFTLATPSANSQLELSHGARHLNPADIYHKLVSLSIHSLSPGGVRVGTLELPRRGFAHRNEDTRRPRLPRRDVHDGVGHGEPGAGGRTPALSAVRGVTVNRGARTPGSHGADTIAGSRRFFGPGCPTDHVSRDTHDATDASLPADAARNAGTPRPRSARVGTPTAGEPRARSYDTRDRRRGISRAGL
jgi:hypothetical protein